MEIREASAKKRQNHVEASIRLANMQEENEEVISKKDQIYLKRAR